MEQQYQIVQEKDRATIATLAKKRVLDYSGYFLTHEEAKRLKEAALGFGTRANTYFALVGLMLNCGLRRAEAVSLRIEQVNMKDMLLELGTDTKTRTPRKVPFNDELKRALIMLIANRKEGAIFMHRSKGYSERRYTQTQVNNIVALVGAKAGIKPKSEGLKTINPHLLRHSWAKFCQKAGMDKNHVRVMGGWKSMKMLDQIYGVPDYETVAKDYKEKMNW